MSTSGPDPNRIFLWMKRVLGLLLRLFFREMEVTGRDNVPADPVGPGGLVVSWHPNGLIDPGLILTQFPRRVVFGARHGLFQWPILKWVLKAVGTVPIYRATDVAPGEGSDQRRESNKKSLDALASEVARGSFAALFPEGQSHDRPHPVELKTGAARLYYRARELQAEGAPKPVIIPVGLHYDKKRHFRSRALVQFHPPIEIPPELDVTPRPGDSEDEIRERARKLTAEIERVLHDVVHATEDWQIHQILHRGRKLIRAERAARAGADPGKPGIGEKALGFARVRAGYYGRLESHPDRVAELKKRVEIYDADMRALRLDDHDLDRDPPIVSPWLAAILIFQVVLVFLLMPPVLVVGTVVNGPTAVGLMGVCKVGAKLEKDEATIKLLLGALLFPATWVATGVLGMMAHDAIHARYPGLPHQPILAGVSLALIAALGGVMSLRYLHVAADTARAFRVRLTRRRRWVAVGRLRHERAKLHDELLKMAEGLDLPGVVADDGTVRPARGA